MKILNSPTRPAKSLQPHHVRHLLTGSLVFIMGIAANETLVILKRRIPRTVQWNQNDIQHDYVVPIGLPPTNRMIDVGVADDGTIVWRVHPTTTNF
jgi:hypothetical protein